MSDATALAKEIHEAWATSSPPLGRTFTTGGIELPEEKRLLSNLKSSKQFDDPAYRSFIILGKLTADAALHYLQYFMLYALERPEALERSRGERANLVRPHAVDFLAGVDNWNILKNIAKSLQLEAMRRFAEFYSKNYKSFSRDGETTLLHIELDQLFQAR